jgi:hypothetical protein
MTRHLLKLALPSESAWLTLYRTHFAVERDGEWQPRPGVEVVILGTLWRETGQMVTVAGPGGDMQVPERVATNSLYHVDLIVPVVPVALYPFLVNPVEPRHVWYGHQLVAMPEVLEDDGDTLMMTRGIGAAVADQQRDAAEIEYVRAKLAAEQREDRRARREAALAVVVQRAARNVAAAERERLTAAVETAVAARDALVAERAAEIVKRDAATASLSGLTGAARIPFVAARDAATTEIQRLAPLITTATAQVQAVQAERAVAGDATVAANVELVRLRAVADALR